MRSFLFYCCLFIPALSFAQDSEWWFDIEVLVFDRNQNITELNEHFLVDETLQMPAADIDLLTALREPNVSWLYQALKHCDSEQQTTELPISFPERQFTFEMESAENEAPPFSLVENWLFFTSNNSFSHRAKDDTPIITMPNIGCKETDFTYNFNAFPRLDVQPVNHFGLLSDNSQITGLLAQTALELEELSLRIRSERGLTRLLHIAWRQEVEFGRENAKSMRIYGGNNYAIHFNEQGRLRSSITNKDIPTVLNDPVTVFENTLNDALSSTVSTATEFEQQLGRSLNLLNTDERAEKSKIPPTTDIWQLEGQLKVFLQYVNRVPYLHIDSDIAYRQPVILDIEGQKNETLISVSDHPFRRVISTQLHYFDHPLYGMLVEIRRVKK